MKGFIIFFKDLVSGFLCFIGDHEWTTAASEGIKPTQRQLDGGILGFWGYTTMYCKRCGKISDLR